MSNEEKTIEQLTTELLKRNVNEHTELKNGLTYLSWAWAWQEVLKIDPTADYEVQKFTDKDGVKRCYMYDATLGYMVFTSVTMRGKTREMWLPVMDSGNNAMLDHAYTARNGKVTVRAATMFDVNKTIMRCLTKNLAMFGLGTYIYAGEDLPMDLGEPCTAEQVARMRELGVVEPNICKRFHIESIEQLTSQQADFVITTKEKAVKNASGV